MYESSCTVTVAATVPKSVPSAVLANAARVRSPRGTIAVMVCPARLIRIVSRRRSLVPTSVSR